MFSGLILTTISVATMRAALFNRKSRSGWLEELDGIRTDALDAKGGELGHVSDDDGVWTDLRDGGEYSDPHEISSLYANDDTPDLPVSRSGSKPAKRPAPRTAPATGHAAAPPPPPPPPPPAPVAPVAPIHEVAAVEPPVEDPIVETPAAVQDSWAQPAPHPVRPSEMWHASSVAPSDASEPFVAQSEDRIDSTDLDDAAPSRARVAGLLESELIGAADMTVVDGVAPSAPTQGAADGLVGAPVGRRVRRDRPVERRRSVLPSPAGSTPAPAPAPTEQSPLPVPPLPPAAMPTKANRLPGLESLPATPSAVVPGPSAPPVVAPAPAPAPAEPPAAPAVTELAVEAVAIGTDDLIAVRGTIVRVGGAKRVSAIASGRTTVIALTEGWCWVAPGDGDADSVRVELPNGTLAIGEAATALVVVEADRSVFIAVADGSVDLRRGSDGAALDRGAIAMVDPAGAAQVDQATDQELQSDPIVAQNLALDADL